MTVEPTGAAPISGISSMATRYLLAELAQTYQRRSGHRVAIESVGGVEGDRRIRAGEAFDVVVLAAEAIAKLAAAGLVDLASRTGIAASGVAIAVPAGVPRPDIGSEQAVRQALLAAGSIGYSTGPSGAHLMRLFQRWGIADTIAPHLVQPPPGVPVGTLLARGDIEIGFQQLSELVAVPGIDVIGSLPPEIQLVTVFAGAVGTASRRPNTAKALLEFLASPEALAAKHRHGLEPARQG